MSKKLAILNALYIFMLYPPRFNKVENSFKIELGLGWGCGGI